MGLNIYVGPLCRYLARDWENAAEGWARESNTKLVTYAPNWPTSFPPVTETLSEVLAWRAALAQHFDEPLRNQSDWLEDPASPYETENVGYTGYGCVVVLGAAQEFPDVGVPETTEQPYQKTAAWKRVQARYGPPGRVDRVLRTLTRASPRVPPIAPFEHVYFPQVWLPIDFERCLFVENESKGQMAIGSVPGLRRQLENIHEDVIRADPGFADAARGEESGPVRTFRKSASRALIQWRGLAAFAHEHRQPMILDS